VVVDEFFKSSRIWDSLIDEAAIPHSRGVLYVQRSTKSQNRMIRRHRVRGLPALSVVAGIGASVAKDIRERYESQLAALNPEATRHGGVLASDEAVIRPSTAINKLVDLFRVNALSLKSAECVIEGRREVNATGRKEFGGVKAETKWQLAVKGPLPQLNMIFPFAFVPPENFGSKTVSLSVVSHQGEAGAGMVWLIESNLLALRNDGKKPGGHELEYLRGEMIQLFPGISWCECRWKWFRVKLPLMQEINRPLAARGIRSGSRHSVVHAYVERLTLAPLLANILNEWRQSCTEVHAPAISDEDALPFTSLADAEDRWYSHQTQEGQEGWDGCDGFEEWSEFISRLTVGSPNIMAS